MENVDGCSINATFAVYGFDGMTNAFKFNGKKTLKAGEKNKIGKVGQANERLPYIAKVISSNKKIVDPEYAINIDLNGNVLLEPDRPGKVTITFKLKNTKKTFKKTFTVTPPDPDFDASIISYNTRNNYFTVKFKNDGVGNLTILSGAKMVNYDYKMYDRNVSYSPCTIKPGKYKVIKMYVKGSNTWPDIEKFRMDYKVSYYNKKYSARSNDDSWYKKGKKWVLSYSMD